MKVNIWKCAAITFILCSVLGTGAEAKQHRPDPAQKAAVTTNSSSRAIATPDLQKRVVRPTGKAAGTQTQQGTFQSRVQDLVNQAEKEDEKEANRFDVRPREQAAATSPNFNTLAKKNNTTKSSGKKDVDALSLKNEDQYRFHDQVFAMTWEEANDDYRYSYEQFNLFGTSNLRKWSSTEGMNTSWYSNYTTDTLHFQPTTIAFLDYLNGLAAENNVTFVITGGAERGYHARGVYSHENGYKVDISDLGVTEGSKPYRVLEEALEPFKHHMNHEWDNNHYDIVIYPDDYQGVCEGGVKKR